MVRRKANSNDSIEFLVSFDQYSLHVTLTSSIQLVGFTVDVWRCSHWTIQALLRNTNDWSTYALLLIYLEKILHHNGRDYWGHCVIQSWRRFQAYEWFVCVEILMLSAVCLPLQSSQQFFLLVHCPWPSAILFMGVIFCFYGQRTKKFFHVHLLISGISLIYDFNR